MAQPTLFVKDANGATVEVNTITDAGRLPAAEAQSVTLSDEDKAVIDAISAKLPALTATDARQPSEVLGVPGVSFSVAAGATSASQALSAGVTRISLVALNADMAFRVGVGAQTAVATDHYLLAWERLDIRVLAGSTIAAIRTGSIDGTLRISELS